MDAIQLINETRYFWLPAVDVLLLWWLFRSVKGLFRSEGA